MNKLSKCNIMSIYYTAYILANSNKSMSRFGNGEFKLMCTRDGNFDLEKNSPLLRKKLEKVIKFNNDKFMVAIPDSFCMPQTYTSSARHYWEIFLSLNGSKIIKYLNNNKIYYNADVSRPYMDYNDILIASKTFKLLKSVWSNKNILIIEGCETRLGVGDDLFSDSNKIIRIECPKVNAFERYSEILHSVTRLLNKYNNKYHFIILISLGSTATVLAYDLFNMGYRAIDVGNIDIEYNWYLIGAKEKINLPYKYVTEAIKGNKSALPIKKKTEKEKYNNEIICNIK